MSIQVNCSRCGATAFVNDALAGQLMKCAQCGGLLQIGVSSGPDAMPMAPVNSRTCGLAIASMVLGILALITVIFAPVLAPLALIFGIIALVRIKNAPELTGSGFAITGIVTSGIALVLLVLIVPAVLLPVLNRARGDDRMIMCRSNLEQIGHAMTIWQLNHQGKLPRLEKTALNEERFPTDSLSLLDPQYTNGFTSIFGCPSTADLPQIYQWTDANGQQKSWFGTKAGRAGAREPTHSSYGYDDTINVGRGSSRLAIAADMDQQAIVNPSWPYGNHSRGANVLYVDGRVSWVTSVFLESNPLDNIFADDSAKGLTPGADCNIQRP